MLVRLGAMEANALGGRAGKVGQSVENGLQFPRKVNMHPTRRAATQPSDLPTGDEDM